MKSRRGRSSLQNPLPSTRGFTLIELMVTLSVLAIFMVIAIPSFTDFRQRIALRGAADQVASFWADARFDAVRRNSLVKIGFVDNGSGSYCVGAATTSDPADDTACDCFGTTTPVCDVSRFPQDQKEWRRIRVPAATTIGAGSGVLVINPKRGNITEAGDAGVISLQSPPGGSLDYRLNVAFDRNGRAVICEPNTGNATLPQYANRRCQ